MNEQKNKELEFIRQILEWAVNEADLGLLTELRWKIVHVIEFREVQAKVDFTSKEQWIDEMLAEIAKKKP